MPLVRYEIRSEYELANRELYRTAPKNDPEAILEGVAMVSLVGIVRQLGDLAEFAADIFHDLHEAVMATASRSHDLIARVSQLEGELPALEKAMFSKKTNQLQFAHAPGAEWHASIRNDQNHCTQGDLPRFIRSSYEECRGPPRLFLLDKFDVGGAGACLKRYTDPSFFKMEWASSELMKAEKAQQDKKARRGKKAKRRKAGDTKDSRQTVQLQPRVRYSSLSISSLDGLSETTTPLSTMPIGNDQINRSSAFATFLGGGSQQGSSKESTGSYPAKPAKSVRRFDLPKAVAATKINGTNLEGEMLQMPKPNEESNFTIEPGDRDEEAFKESMDDVASETDQYLDAMTTMESETDSEPRERRRFDINDFKPAMAALGSETDSDSKARQDDTDVFFEDARNSTMESETEAESQYSVHLTPIRVAPQLELEQDGEAPVQRELELEQAFELEGDPVEPQLELEQDGEAPVQRELELEQALELEGDPVEPQLELEQDGEAPVQRELELEQAFELEGDPVEPQLDLVQPADPRSKMEQAVEDVDDRVEPHLNLWHASEDVGTHLELEQPVSIHKEQALADSLRSTHNTLDKNIESEDGNISQHEKPKELDEDDILQHEQAVLESDEYEEHTDSEVEDDEQFDVEVIQVIGGVRDEKTEVEVEPAVVLEEESTEVLEPRSKKGVDVDDSTSPVDMKTENEVDTLDSGDYIEIEPSLDNQTGFEIAEGNGSEAALEDKFDRPVRPLDSSTVDGSLKEATDLGSIEAGDVENFIEPRGLGFEEANTIEVSDFAEVSKLSSTKEMSNNDLASGPHEESAPSDGEFENNHGLKAEEASELMPGIVHLQEIPVKDSSFEESNEALINDEIIPTVSAMDDFESATSQEDFSEEQSSSRFSDTGFSDENDLHDDGSPEMDLPHQVHSRGDQMERDERGPSFYIAGGSGNHDDLTKTSQSEETAFDWLPRSAIPLIPEVESGNERKAEQQHKHEERYAVEHGERFLDHGDNGHLDEEQADTEANIVSRPQSPQASPAQSATGIGIILGNAISKGASNAESPISSSTSAPMQLSLELPDERDISGAVSPLSIKVSSPECAVSSEASSSSSPVSSNSSGSSSPKSPIFSALHAPMSPIRSEDHLRGGLSTMLTPVSPLLKTVSSSPKLEEMPPPPPLPPLRWRTAQSPGHYQAPELPMPPLEQLPGRSEASELFMPPPEQSPERSAPELFMPPSGRFEAPELFMRTPDGHSEAPELFILPPEESLGRPEFLMSPPEQSLRRAELLMSPPEQSPRRSQAPELLLPPPEHSSGRSQAPELLLPPLEHSSGRSQAPDMLLPPAEQLPRHSQAPELLMPPPEQSPRRFEAPELLTPSPEQSARRSQAPELLMSPPEQSPRRFEAPELLMPFPEQSARRSQAPELLSPEQSPRRSQAPELMMPPPPLPPALPDRTTDALDNQSLPVSTMSSKRSLADDALIHSISLHDRTKLKKVASEIRPDKAPDERGFLLEQIRSQSFNLRHTVVEKKVKQDPPPRLITNINVAAILEKANAIRQAFAGSDDDEDDDDWSDA